MLAVELAERNPVLHMRKAANLIYCCCCSHSLIRCSTYATICLGAGAGARRTCFELDGPCFIYLKAGEVTALALQSLFLGPEGQHYKFYKHTCVLQSRAARLSLGRDSNVL
jgi:hypothetical protein